MSSFESPLPPLPPSSTPFPCQSPSQCHLRPPSCCCHFLPYTPFTPSFSHCLLHPSFWSSSLSILQCTVLCVHLTIPASHQTHFFIHHHHIATYILKLVAAISFLSLLSLPQILSLSASPSPSLSILQHAVFCVYFTVRASLPTHFFVHHHYIPTYILQIVAAIPPFPLNSPLSLFPSTIPLITFPLHTPAYCILCPFDLI